MEETNAPVIGPVKHLLTEDLGKIFEMAICLLYMLYQFNY
jgi:hypothetical protein